MNIAKNTAKRMLESIEQQLHQLASEQQSMNGNKGGSAQFRCGGKIKRHRMQSGGTPPGGYTEDPRNWLNGIQGFGMDQYKTDFGISPLPYGNMQPFTPMYTGDLSGGAPTKKVALDVPNTGVGNIGGMNQHVASPLVNTGVKLPGLQGINNPMSSGANRPGNSGSAMDWMGLLPTAFNLGAGLFSGRAQHLNANRFQNPYEQQALSQMPSQYRIDPLLNEYKNVYANTVRNINNQGNSRGERMANYGAAQNQYGQQVTGAYADKFNQENTMATRRAMLMQEQGQQRAGINLGVQNMNDQNQAAALNNRMSYLGAAASGAQRYSLVNKQMANQQASQMAYIRALANMPHFQQWLGLDPNNPLGLQNNR